jgi:chromosome segregation ATPase
MATVTSKIHCVTCKKEKVTYKCEGCAQKFCLNHLVNHHQLLIKQLDEIENQQNLFRQLLSEQSDDQQKHSLIQQINQWEKNSIQKIQQMADEVRQVVIEHASKHMKEIEIRLTKLTEELKLIRQEDDFNEIHLNQLKEKLNQLEEQFKKPSRTIIVEENSSAFINEISVFITSVQGKSVNMKR